MKMQVNFLLLVLCWNIPYLFADPIVSYEPVIETLTSRTITLSCEVTFDGDTFPVGWALNTGIYIPRKYSNKQINYNIRPFTNHFTKSNSNTNRHYGYVSYGFRLYN